MAGGNRLPPSGEKATVVTTPKWPLKAAWKVPVAVSSDAKAFGTAGGEELAIGGNRKVANFG